MLTAKIARSIALVGRTQFEMELRGLTTEKPFNPWEDVAFLCTASWCLEEAVDSHGECIHCGEPVVRCWPTEAPRSGRSVQAP